MAPCDFEYSQKEIKLFTLAGIDAAIVSRIGMSRIYELACVKAFCTNLHERHPLAGKALATCYRVITALEGPYRLSAEFEALIPDEILDLQN